MRNYGSHGGGVYRRRGIERDAGKLQRCLSLCLALLTITGFVGLGASCSGGNAGLPARTAGHDGLPAAVAAQLDSLITAGAKLVACQGDFALYILPEPAQLAQQAGQISLSVAERGGEVVVTVEIAGAQDLRGICAELAYPRERYSPVAARCGAVLGSAEEQVSLYVTDTPGVAALDAVLKNWPQRDGVNGAGELAQVRFARRACTGVRRVSRAPDWDEAQARLALDVTHARLEWECLLPGDYNQDGTVNIGDIAMVAIKWNDPGLTETYSYPDPRARLFEFNAQGNKDGNRDGRISAADFYYLGYHLGERIKEYWIYHSPDPTAEMPDGNGAQSKIQRAGRVAYNSRQFDPLTKRYYMSIPVVDPTPSDAYWVRPSDGASEGTPSNYAWYDTSVKDALTLTVEPITYIYGGSASFSETVYTQQENIIAALQAHDVDALTCFSLDVRFDPETFECLDGDQLLHQTPSLPAGALYAIAETYGLINCVFAPSTKPVHEVISGSLIQLANCRFTRGIQSSDMNTPGHGWYRDASYNPLPSIDFDLVSGTLHWWYAAPGDTNQDGAVLFDDVIMIDYYWGEIGPFPLDSLQMVTDCNRNHVIDVSDQTAIGAYMHSQTTGYFIYASADPNDVPGIDEFSFGPPAIDPIGYVPFSAAHGDPQVERLRFSANIGTPPSGTYLWVMPEYNGLIGDVSRDEYVYVP